MPVDLPEVAVFASGRYATAWTDAGAPCAWSTWTDDDLQRMAENDARLRATGQPVPYVKPSHDAEPVPGQIGPLRYAAGKLYACIEKCADWLAEQIQAGVRPWRSAEILRDASAANFQGVTGPVFKGLALLNTHPRVKTLDSAVYADTNFAEPGALPGSFLVTFEEGAMPSADQVLAALKALGMDDKLLKKVLDALGLSTAEGGAAEPPPAPMADKQPAVTPMSDAAAKLQADNALLKAQVDELRKQRMADVQLDRTRQIIAFSDAVSLSHGKAIGDAVKASAEARMKSLPVTENFADGRDLVADVFGEIKALIGPATMRRSPTAAGTPGGVETFSEETAKAEIFADTHPLERAHLQSVAGKSLLDTLIARRKAEHEAGRVS